MYQLRKYLLVTVLLILANSSHAQWGMDTLPDVIRPRIGLGVGTITYYGEVQNYQKGFTPTINRYYGMAYVNAPLTKYFNLEITASYGKVSANERSLVSNLNFQSRIRMLSAQVYYNMYPVLNNRKLMFHPFFGFGISSFEFLSKTDMYDAEGNQYHYWSDGSIMNMAEDDPQAVNAVSLSRDYVYETDLREQNLDGLGDYREQSFTLPLTAGIEFHLSPRWDFRIASTFHFTFTDLIDNVTPAGQGPERHGDGKKDKLWTNYITLSYDLQLPKSAAKDPFKEIELYVDFEQNDWDNDGVIDAYDECPETPLEALVDDKGCPLDGDEDGVPDYRDDEPNTPEGNWVDEFGVTMTEEDIAKHWKEFNDSTGYDHDFVVDEKVVEFGKDDVVRLVDPYENKKDKSYVIIIGKEHKSVSANELHKYLGYENFETEVRGDTVYYKLGEYATIEDAVAAKTEMEKEGIDVKLIGRDGSVDSTFFTVSDEVVNKVEQLNKENNKEAPEINTPDEQVFRVQIGAFKNKVNEEEVFKGVDTDDITHATGEDGITRYYAGKFNDYKEANEFRKDLIGKGYRSAFVVAYEGGERKTLQELDVDPKELPDYYDEDKELNSFVEPREEDTDNSNMVNGIDMTKVKYRIKLAEYEAGAKVPTGDLDIYLNIGNVKPITAEDGKKTFYSPPFDSKEDAQNAIEDYKSYGLENLQPFVEYESEFFTVEEFEEKLKP